MKSNRWFIIITYGDCYQNIIKNFDSYFSADCVGKIVVVDTKNGLINNIFSDFSEINSHFEFSGYEAGLNWVLNNEENEIVDCIFMNDTVFYSHLKMHIVRYFQFIVNIKLTATSIVGVVNDFCGIKYIPSCFFRVVIDKRVLGSGNTLFYDNKSCDVFMYSDQYIAHVKKWLYPKNIWSGWYKAIPWKPIDNETYERKLCAIRLEHSLLSLFMEKTQGHVLDLSLEHPVLKITAFLDRIYMNVLKIKHRLVYLFNCK